MPFYAIAATILAQKSIRFIHGKRCWQGIANRKRIDERFIVAYENRKILRIGTLIDADKGGGARACLDNATPFVDGYQWKSIPPVGGAAIGSVE